MSIVILNGLVVQVRKSSDERDSLRYEAKIYCTPKQMREFVFEYDNGNFQIKYGNASDRERDLLIHCIQALELSIPFPGGISIG